MDHELGFDRHGAGDASVVGRAERARRAGDPIEAARIARDALLHGDDAALRAALALALLDQGEVEEARHALEMLLEALAGDDVGLHAGVSVGVDAAHSSMISDNTLAAATAAALELVGSLDDASFERALEAAETQHELMLDADSVAEQALREIPAELPDELLPSADSPFATRTFADLLERQGHEEEADTLRSSLASQPPAPGADGQGPHGGSLATLERWLENLRRTAA